MFNIGGGEFLVIGLIALIVLGPSRLPDAARQAGKVMADLRKVSTGFQNEIRNAFEDADRSPSPDPAPSTFPVVEPLGGPVDPDQMAGALAAVSAQADPVTTKKRAPAKKAAAAKKPVAKKTPTKKAAAKKAPAPKKAAPKKAAPKKAAAKKAPAKKAPAKKAVPTSRSRRSTS